MRQYSYFGAILSLLFSGNPVWAATYSDPSWPCIQRKVETLSLGLMWPHPIQKTGLQGNIAAAAGELVEKLALRRISLEETQPLIAEFVQANSDVTLDVLGYVFKQTFERIATDRDNIMEGIAKYSFRQIALSQKVDKTRTRMTDLMKAAEPDFDAVDKLEEQLDWDERIFKVRAKSLTYVCETPILLEKRLFAIARELLKHAP
ncbi:MAG: hypothetical protein GY742_18695 [Hyphomicrobiales bacterium]|nr:hypothetical protein [Hyphomicrobiales bacterium]